MKLLKFGLPLIGFIVVAIFLALGLKNDPRYVPSPLIDKAAPAFSLPTLVDDETLVSNQDMLGQIWLMNVWASWCAACKVEHPVLLSMAAQGATIVGLNYKDNHDDAVGWLQRYDNPYSQVIVDAGGQVGIDFGVYGVPETFLIDKDGKIRFKHIGPVAEQDAQQLLALVAQLESES